MQYKTLKQITAIISNTGINLLSDSSWDRLNGQAAARMQAPTQYSQLPYQGDPYT